MSCGVSLRPAMLHDLAYSKPRHGNTCLRVSDQVRHKSDCTATQKMARSLGNRGL